MELSYIYLGKSLTESAGDLIVDGSCHFCDVVCGNFVDSVRTHYDDFVAYVHFGNVGNVYHALVHADVACDGTNDSVNDDLAVFGVRTGISVGIAKGEGSDLGRSFGNELASVSYGESNADFLEMSDIGLDGHYRLEIKLISVNFVGRIESVKNDACTASVEVSCRKLHDGSRIC